MEIVMMKMVVVMVMRSVMRKMMEIGRRQIRTQKQQLLFV